MNQLNLLQENSNLPIEFKVLEEYLLQKQSVSPLNFTTGLYGMLVFSRMIDNLFGKNAVVLTGNLTILGDKDPTKERFIKYRLFNGQEIKIIQDDNLDNTGNTNEHTGFTVESSMLYLKN